MGFQINPNITLVSIGAEKREAARAPYVMRNFAPLYMAGNLLVGGFDETSEDSRQKQLHRALCDEPVQDALDLPVIARSEAMTRLSEDEVRRVGGLVQEVAAENGLVFARFTDN